MYGLPHMSKLGVSPPPTDSKMESQLDQELVSKILLMLKKLFVKQISKSAYMCHSLTLSDASFLSSETGLIAKNEIK